MRTKSEKIETIRKRFRKKSEWLLIRVDRVDEETTTPLTGRLIAHSPLRDEIYKKSMSYKGPAMINFAGKPDKDVAYIFGYYA